MFPTQAAHLKVNEWNICSMREVLRSQYGSWKKMNYTLFSWGREASGSSFKHRRPTNKGPFAAILNLWGIEWAGFEPACSVCRPHPSLWSRQCVSTANHFQLWLWSFTAWIITVRTHVWAWGPNRGRVSARHDVRKSSFERWFTYVTQTQALTSNNWKL